MSASQNILLVDNDLMYLDPYVAYLEGEGYRVFVADTFTAARNALTNNEIDLVFTDIMMPLTSEAEEKELMKESKAGYETGLVLAKWIKKNYPQVPVIGFTVRLDEELAERFLQYGLDLKTKFELRRGEDFVAYVRSILNKGEKRRPLKVFIVHGHDDLTKYELKNYIQSTLKLGEPIILHEQPSLGRTIIEKFEDIASDIDLVFVLLTPDDAVYDSTTPNSIKRRARQNVVLELGYFLAKLERKKGRVLLLYKGELELPSDIGGLVYIDISSGIENAGELIRRELAGFS